MEIPPRSIQGPALYSETVTDFLDGVCYLSCFASKKSLLLRTRANRIHIWLVCHFHVYREG